MLPSGMPLHNVPPEASKHLCDGLPIAIINCTVSQYNTSSTSLNARLGRDVVEILFDS